MDGLRGIAISLVLIGHLTTSERLNSFDPSGVVVFFTLSGFLITALLLHETDNDGRIRLLAFYRRRVRRLGPALLACLATFSVVGLLLPGFMNWHLALGAVSYSANWMRVHEIGDHSPMAHTWSLSIEEQFYIVWPLILMMLARGSRRLQQTVLVVATVALTLWTFSLTDHGAARIYFGTDTRAPSLLIGCLVAVILHQRPIRSVPRWTSTAVLLLLLGVVAALHTPGYVLLVSPLLVSVLTAVLIWCVCQSRNGALEWPPLVGLGKRSYGLYLWHWPVLVLVERWVTNPWLVAVAATPIFTVLTMLSWHFVERPRNRPDQGQHEPPTTSAPSAEPAPGGCQRV